MMDPMQRARYDAAVQKYHDGAAVHRERFESEMAKARGALRDLAKRSKESRRNRAPEVRDIAGAAPTSPAEQLTAGREMLARGFVHAKSSGAGAPAIYSLRAEVTRIESAGVDMGGGEPAEVPVAVAGHTGARVHSILNRG